MTMDMAQYLDVFLEESKEHLENLNQQLLALEKNPQNIGALNEIFRAAHTLKGMSSTMGYEDLADLTHHMEDVLSDLKEGLLQAGSYVVDTLFKCLDRAQSIIDQIENTGSGECDNQDLIYILNNIKSGDTGVQDHSPVGENAVEEPPTVGADKSYEHEFNSYDITVLKEAVSKGYQIMALTVGVDPSSMMKSVRAFMVFKVLEEDCEVIKTSPAAQELEEGKFDDTFDMVIITKTSAAVITSRLEHISEVHLEHLEIIDADKLSATTKPAVPSDEIIAEQDSSITDARKSTKLKQTVRVDIDRLDNLMNLVGELVMHKGRLEQIGYTRKIVELNETIEQIDRISTDLQSVVTKVRMVPIEQVFNRFPRMVRDLAKDLGKEIDFIIEGKETELDRTVIDEIGDPLVHLLRNAIDHGIESAPERVKNGKPKMGTVILRARHEGNNVYIEVEDDGGGIKVDKVKQKAVDKGLLNAQEADLMTREETIDMLFSSGFSTAEQITDVSGRGVGLDVVKSKIESLNGEIQVESKPGQGTRFKIKLPLTLAIIQALMISLRDEIYAIPLSFVDETTIISQDDIKLVQNQEVIVLRGSVLPLYRLDQILGTPGESESDETYVVVVRRGEKQIGLVVDALIGQQEIVIKSLGKILTGIPGIAGAIVAGDGHVRLILDITTLL